MAVQTPVHVRVFAFGPLHQGLLLFLLFRSRLLFGILVSLRLGLLRGVGLGGGQSILIRGRSLGSDVIGCDFCGLLLSRGLCLSTDCFRGYLWIDFCGLFLNGRRFVSLRQRLGGDCVRGLAGRDCRGIRFRRRILKGVVDPVVNRVPLPCPRHDFRVHLPVVRHVVRLVREHLEDVDSRGRADLVRVLIAVLERLALHPQPDVRQQRRRPQVR
mmetsp:Transcript_13703/g.58551  ORF Transcript_13703/g.58551 Transcript_13703/m.58551 type:complete len:214 (-) Transcript_13703:52-693(-)